jgi:hypothetical protein
MADAGPDDEIFVIDRDAGTVKFGDGVHGRLLPSGAEVVVAVYRRGGSSGNEPKDAAPIQLRRAGAVDAIDAALWTVTRAPTSSIPFQIKQCRHRPGDQHPPG